MEDLTTLKTEELLALLKELKDIVVGEEGYDKALSDYKKELFQLYREAGIYGVSRKLKALETKAIILGNIQVAQRAFSERKSVLEKQKSIKTILEPKWAPVKEAERKRNEKRRAIIAKYGWQVPVLYK